MLDINDLVYRHKKFGTSDKVEESRKVIYTLATYGIDFDKMVRGIQVDEYQAILTKPLSATKLKTLTEQIKIDVNSESVSITRNGNTLKIDVPANNDSTLFMGDVLTDEYRQQTGLTLTVGKAVSGENIYIDLAKMPHILVGGTTGSGKSMLLHSFIISLMVKNPDIEIYGVDTKRVECGRYSDIPTFHAIDEARAAVSTLHDLVDEMERRYFIFSQHGYRDIDSARENGMDIQPIVVVIDEFADLIKQSKAVETYVVRLAQKARAAGIHLIIGTQSPRKDVVTGLIKANLPCKICMKVDSGMESRIVLDHMGGEKLIGHGDLLLSLPGEFDDIRCQGVFLHEMELTNITNTVFNYHVSKQPKEEETAPKEKGIKKFLKWLAA